MGEEDSRLIFGFETFYVILNSMNLEELRQICLALPHASEDIKWGNDLCFLIAEKMFPITGLDRVSPGATFKVAAEDFDEMILREGFSPAPYMARYKWVAIDDISRLSAAEWSQLAEEAYLLVKAKLPKRVQKELE